MTEVNRNRLAILLAAPDEPCLIGLWGKPRGRTYICGRDPRRDPWIIKRDLGIAYAEHVRQAWTNGDISGIVSKRTYRLALVRRA